MRFSKVIATLILASTPLIASAETMITIINNTDSYGTGYAGFSPCSTIAGDAGIIKPHETKSLDISAVSMFCGDRNCDGHVFLNKSCSGRQMAKVVVNAKKGIISVTNYDTQHYNVTIDGNTARIDPV